MVLKDVYEANCWINTIVDYREPVATTSFWETAMAPSLHRGAFYSTR
jgi:hypothetical protein